MRRVLALPEVADALVAQGMEVAPGSAEAMAARMRSDTVRWATVIRQAGIKAE
jgi:tripartite-type tricarboxylate transporter receptor subunit TctC